MCAFFVGDRKRSRGLLLGIRCFTTCFEELIFARVINSAFHRLLGAHGGIFGGHNDWRRYWQLVGWCQLS